MLSAIVGNRPLTELAELVTVMFVRTVCTLILFVGPLISGCGPGDPTPTIRARFQQMAGYLCTDNVDACVTLADPIYVRAQGTEKVKFQLKLLAGLIKLGKLTEQDIRVDQINVAEDGKTAQVQFSLQSNGEWKSQNPSNWVLSDGQWYYSP